MTVPPTSVGLLLSSVLDVRDRYLRLLHGVTILRNNLDAGVRAALVAATVTIKDSLRGFEIHLRETLDQSLDENDPNNPDSWSDAYLRNWALFATNHFSALQSVQYKVFPYLPITGPPPADIAYFVARCVGLSPTRKSHRARFALSYSQYTLWESMAVGAGQVAAVPIPYPETLSPLRWPLLVHEVGHHLIPSDEEGRTTGLDRTHVLVNRHLPNATAGAQSDFEEVLADRVAESACGNSYALALLREAQLTSYAQHTHRTPAPAVLSRLRVLDAWDVLGPVLPPPWRSDLERAVGVDADLSPMREIALNLIPPGANRAIRPTVVERAVGLLTRGEPAPAVSQTRLPEFDTIHLSNRDGGSDAAINDIFASSADVACRDVEILEAAWQLEACQAAGAYIATLSNSLLRGTELDQEKVELARGQRAKRDTAISRSLQAAAVHRWLLEYDDGIRSRAQEANAVHAEAIAGALVSASVRPARAAESSPLADLHLVARLRADDASRLVVRPLIDPAQIGGTTIDLRLGTEWEVLRSARFQALDPAHDEDDVIALLDASVEQFRLTAGQADGLVLHPDELVLVLTLEYISLPDDLWGNIEGRSTWARLGLQVHASAGMVDGGFEGYLTLELQNMGRLPMVLSPGLRVAQLACFPSQDIARPYARKVGAAYSDQTSARTAFPRQHEHRALRAYVLAERSAEEALGRSATPATGVEA